MTDCNCKQVNDWIKFDGWGMPDPDSVYLNDLLWRARYSQESISQMDIYNLCSMAEAYQHFAGHVAPNRMIIGQLRKLRRAVRELRKGGSDD